MGDNFQDEIRNRTDPEVDDAIAIHREEAPEAYDDTGALSRPSRSSRSSRPQLTGSILRDMGRHGGRGEGFRGNTPINPEQLKGEAQTRAFFRRADQNKPSTQINPYQMKDDAAALKEFYSPTQGSLKGQHFDQPSQYSDTTLAASNEAWNAVPHKRGTMSERSIPHINPYQPDPFTKKRSGETSISDLDRQEKSLAWMADPKNNKGRTEFQQYESSPAERNPQLAYSDKLANQRAYLSALNKNKRISDSLKTQSEFPATDYEKEAEEYQKSNQSKSSSGQPSTKEELTQRPFIPSKSIPEKFRAEKQGRIDPNNRSTWTVGEIQMDPNKIRTMGQAKARPSSYFSPITGKQEITTVFDQPQHTEQLAKLAVNNEKYNDDLKNSIWAEMIARKQDKKEKASFGDKPLPSESKKIEKIADIATSIQHFKNLLNESKKVAPNGKTEANFAENQKLRGYIDKLKKDYALELRYEPEIPNIRPTMMPLGI